MSIPPDREIRGDALWRTITANSYKAQFGIFAILDFIIFLTLLVVAAFLSVLFSVSIPWIPTSLFSYGLIYHLPHAIWWILVLGMAGSRNTTYITIVGVLGIFILFLDLFAAAIFAIWFVGCLLGDPVNFVADCIVSSLFMLSLAVFSVIFLVITAIILVSTVGLLRHIWRGDAKLDRHAAAKRE